MKISGRGHKRSNSGETVGHQYRQVRKPKDFHSIVIRPVSTREDLRWAMLFRKGLAPGGTLNRKFIGTGHGRHEGRKGLLVDSNPYSKDWKGLTPGAKYEYEFQRKSCFRKAYRQMKTSAWTNLWQDRRDQYDQRTSAGGRRRVARQGFDERINEKISIKGRSFCTTTPHCIYIIVNHSDMKLCCPQWGLMNCWLQ